MSEKSPIRTFSDYVFGLVVVFSAFSLTGSVIQAPMDLVNSIALFALSFAILITVWHLYDSLMAKLRVETSTAFALNIVLLFLAVLEPFLLNIILSNPSISDFAAICYAIDMAGLLGICALLAHLLTVDRRNALSIQMSKTLRSERNVLTIIAAIFLVSSAPSLATYTFFGWTLRSWLWVAILFVYPIRKAIEALDVKVGMWLNTVLLRTAVRIWLMEILVSGFNFFVLMNLVYEPRFGVLVAHQIGMSSRISSASICGSMR
jgi:uncharacterized membrane protein